jgi:signal transduction histidine kinase
MQHPLSQQGFTLKTRIDDPLPGVVIDLDAMEQAILNLLTNALKYSGNSRSIEMSCRRSADGVAVDVRDFGIGISPENQTRVFEKFYRVPASGSDGIAGTGLGLTLVKHIVEAHGGRLEISSSPGCGSTFTIDLPLHGTEATA